MDEKLIQRDMLAPSLPLQLLRDPFIEGELDRDDPVSCSWPPIDAGHPYRLSS